MKVLRVKLPADLYKKIRVKAALDETSIGELAEKGLASVSLDVSERET